MDITKIEKWTLITEKANIKPGYYLCTHDCHNKDEITQKIDRLIYVENGDFPNGEEDTFIPTYRFQFIDMNTLTNTSDFIPMNESPHYFKTNEQIYLYNAKFITDDDILFLRTLKSTTRKKQGKQSIQYFWKKPTAFFAKLQTLNVFLYGFYVLILLSIINIGIMTIHLFDEKYEYPILSYSYIDAITPEQDINGVLSTDIIKILEFNPNTISTGDQVVVCCDFGIEQNWVEEIITINYEAHTMDVTYDQVSTMSVPFDRVIGEYSKDANIMGTIYFSSKFLQGYAFLSFSHVLLLVLYYFSFVNRRKK